MVRSGSAPDPYAGDPEEIPVRFRSSTASVFCFPVFLTERWAGREAGPRGEGAAPCRASPE